MRRDDPDRYLQVVAFVAHRFYRLQDNFVDVLLASLRSFQNGASLSRPSGLSTRRNSGVSLGELTKCV
jgi:hypothetical protein